LKKEKAGLDEKIDTAYREGEELETDRSPLLKEIYPKVSISVEDIISELHKKRAITEKLKDELFSGKR